MSGSTITASNLQSLWSNPVEHYMQNADTDVVVSVNNDVSETVQMSQLPLTCHDDSGIDVIMDLSVVLDLLSSLGLVNDDEIDLQFDINDNLTTSLTTDSSTSASEHSLNSTFNNEQSPKVSASPVTSANWNHYIDSIFSLQAATRLQLNKKRRAIKSHRLLTSDEFIQENLVLERKKKQKLEMCP